MKRKRVNRRMDSSLLSLIYLINSYFLPEAEDTGLLDLIELAETFHCGMVAACDS